MKKVLIVREGSWGMMKPADYETQVELYREALEAATELDPYTKTRKKAATIEVVPTAQEAVKKLRTEGAHVVVFISRGMESEAETMAEEFPRVRVVVLTGLIPEGEVVWVNKGWFTSQESIQAILLSG